MQDSFGNNYRLYLDIGFPGGAVVKNLPTKAGDTRDADSVFVPGRPPGVGNVNQLQYSCLENSMDRGAWQATAYGVTKNWTEHTAAAAAAAARYTTLALSKKSTLATRLLAKWKFQLENQDFRIKQLTMYCFGISFWPSMQDLSSSSRHQTCVSCSESMEA